MGNKFEPSPYTEFYHAVKDISDIDCKHKIYFDPTLDDQKDIFRRLENEGLGEHSEDIKRMIEFYHDNIDKDLKKIYRNDTTVFFNADLKICFINDHARWRKLVKEEDNPEKVVPIFCSEYYKIYFSLK